MAQTESTSACCCSAVTVYGAAAAQLGVMPTPRRVLGARVVGRQEQHAEQSSGDDSRDQEPTKARSAEFEANVAGRLSSSDRIS